jgi:hypothetical protein
LSHKKWKLAFSDGEKKRMVNIEARDLEATQKRDSEGKNSIWTMISPIDYEESVDLLSSKYIQN